MAVELRLIRPELLRAHETHLDRVDVEVLLRAVDLLPELADDRLLVPELLLREREDDFAEIGATARSAARMRVMSFMIDFYNLAGAGADDRNEKKEE